MVNMTTVNRDEIKKQKNREKVKRYRTKMRLKLRAMKEKPCADCGIQYPYYVMQFDHIRGKKKLALAKAYVTFTAWSNVVEEVAKCEVVCSNCHLQRTWKRGQHLTHNIPR